MFKLSKDIVGLFDYISSRPDRAGMDDTLYFVAMIASRGEAK
jgi:hypothetical protein